MSKYLINGESIEAIADGFRTSRGTEQKYTLDEMAVLAAEKVGGGGGLAPNERVYQVGNATAEVTIAFTTSAIGATS